MEIALMQAAVPDNRSQMVEAAARWGHVALIHYAPQLVLTGSASLDILLYSMACMIVNSVPCQLLSASQVCRYNHSNSEFVARLFPAC
jgi:hypothetical protein